MPVLRPPAGAPDAPQQFKQPSRKGKKAWRKNVDVTDVQKGLEQRNEEIIRGGVFAERDSKDLFVLDVVGDARLSKNLPKRLKGLKADEIIAKRSAVPAVALRKRPSERTTDGIIPAKRPRTGYVSQKELARLRSLADGHHESTVAVTNATYDPWAVTEPAEADKPAEEVFSFLSKPEKPKIPDSMMRQPISLAASGKAIPAVPKPRGGHSYNPVYTDYEERLAQEGAKVLEAEKKRIQQEEAERIRQEAIARSAAEAEAAEARADLSEWDEDSAWEGFESGGEELSVKAKRPQRKTPAERNKVKRRKEAEGKAKHEQAARKRDEQARRIKLIAQEVAEREQARALAKAERSDDDSDEDEGELRRRQLGKFKLPEKDLELVLPDELQESLRLLKPEGNLLKDRYRSLLVRGKLESRRHIPFRKQAKVKYTEKWSHKDFKL